MQRPHFTLGVGAAAIAALLAAPRPASAVGPDPKSPHYWSEKVPGSIRSAKEHFVAPDGKADGKGTKDKPWDIVSTLRGKQAVEPGSIVWLREGTYRWPGSNNDVEDMGFECILKGTAEKPIHVRAYPGEHAILDGGLRLGDRNMKTPADHVWVWDLDIMVKENLAGPGISKQKGSWPKDLGRRTGGLTFFSGTGTKVINTSVHHNTSSGVGFWATTFESELHGCLVHNNGWIGPDRNHGHGIYGQNKDKGKWVTDNILFGNMDHLAQFYGADAGIDNFHIEGNIGFGAHPKSEHGGRFLVGGAKPGHNVLVKDNLFHGALLQVGYKRSPGFDHDCVVEGNIIARGELSTDGWQKLTNRDNRVWKRSEKGPEKPIIVLRPNKYDPRRANLAVVNAKKEEKVSVDLSAFLKNGERYRIQKATDFYGEPVLKGSYSGGSVAVPIPVIDRVPERELGVFVILKD